MHQKVSDIKIDLNTYTLIYTKGAPDFQTLSSLPLMEYFSKIIFLQNLLKEVWIRKGGYIFIKSTLFGNTGHCPDILDYSLILCRRFEPSFYSQSLPYYGQPFISLIILPSNLLSKPLTISTIKFGKNKTFIFFYKQQFYKHENKIWFEIIIISGIKSS